MFSPCLGEFSPGIQDSSTNIETLVSVVCRLSCDQLEFDYSGIQTLIGLGKAWLFRAN